MGQSAARATCRRDEGAGAATARGRAEEGGRGVGEWRSAEVSKLAGALAVWHRAILDGGLALLRD